METRTREPSDTGRRRKDVRSGCHPGTGEQGFCRGREERRRYGPASLGKNGRGQKPKQRQLSKAEPCPQWRTTPAQPTPPPCSHLIWTTILSQVALARPS